MAEAGCYYTRAMLSVPSLDRVGAFPCMTILCTALMVYLISFYDWLSSFVYIIDAQAKFQDSVIASLVILALPCSLLYLFIVSQISQRMAYSTLNPWQLVHFVFFCFTFVTSLLYLLTNTEECFNFITTLIQEDVTQIKQVQQLIDNLHWIKNPSQGFVVGLKYVCSYAFLLQFFVAMLFATFACSHFGQRKIMVSIRDTGSQYTVLVETRKNRKEAVRSARANVGVSEGSIRPASS